jgi:hypothetical protein
VARRISGCYWERSLESEIPFPGMRSGLPARENDSLVAPPELLAGSVIEPE